MLYTYSERDITMNEINQNDQIDQAAQDQEAFDDMMAETRLRRHLDDTIEKDTHDPDTCGCEYVAFNMWSCGHIDGEPDDVVEIREVSLEEQGNRLGDRSL